MHKGSYSQTDVFGANSVRGEKKEAMLNDAMEWVGSVWWENEDLLLLPVIE